MDPALIYLVAGIISATIILVLALSSRPRTGTSSSEPIKLEGEESVVEEKRGVAGPEPLLTVDWDEIARLRSQSLKGLVSGYGCSDFRFRPVFPSGVLPSGFEGTWECCLLGQGGWGSAYLCRKGNVKAVFKTPRGFESIIEGRGEPPTVHSKTLEKVRNEANTISKLEHPHIIKLLSYSEKTPLLIYEYADYGTLHWQLSKGWKPSQKDIPLIGIQLGDALRYLHSKGLIHGDIKPSNVFIKDGVIKLGDFSSITKLLSTMSYSRIPSTIGFRAPEQVYSDIMKKAKEEGLENRIDVYQLANALLYMLTGESIDGEEAIDRKHVEEKLSEISNKELRETLAKALDPDPAKRPSSEELTKTLYRIYEKMAKR
jgi:serine/threonine-protein kinase